MNSKVKDSVLVLDENSSVLSFNRSFLELMELKQDESVRPGLGSFTFLGSHETIKDDLIDLNKIKVGIKIKPQKLVV